MSRAIYIDFDDVLCHTIEVLLDLLAERHGRRVRREEVRHFDLERSFALSPDEIAAFMEHAHEPDVLLAMPPREAASGVLRDWAAAGHGIHVVTGRPAGCERPSRAWLEAHGLPVDSLQFVDKYGRYPDCHRTVSLDRLGCQRFDLVVEDSLSMARFAVERWEAPVALIDQPWNRDVSELPAAVRARIVRCGCWAEVAERFPLATCPEPR